MKYTKNSPPLACMQTTSTCYTSTYVQRPVGVLWHCTGCNNPNIKRYVQPSDNAPDRAEMLQILGVNQYGNDWNHIYHGAGLNAWIGKLADGTVTTVQTMPWNYRPWGCGKGKKGSCNSGWIQFEMCEDALTDPVYFEKAYQEAVQLTAYLCDMYGIDPLGKTNGIPNILCHWDSYKLGMGNGHVDIYNWFDRYYRDMDDVRRDVYSAIHGNTSDEQEEEKMTQEEFNAMFGKALAGSEDVVTRMAAIAIEQRDRELKDNDAGDWSEADRAWAVESGLFQGADKLPSGDSNYMWESAVTREQTAALFHRFYDMINSKLDTILEALQKQ